MKILILSTWLWMFVRLAASAQVSFGLPEKINDHWQFILGEPEAGTAPEFSRRTRSVQLPHDWSVEGILSPTLASATGYLPGGVGWYRKTLFIPSDETGRKVYLYFECVYNRSEIFVHGHSAGSRPNGYVSFMYDVTPYVNYGTENEILVRVDHSRSAASRWYTGSVIYRDVWVDYAQLDEIHKRGGYAYHGKTDERHGQL